MVNSPKKFILNSQRAFVFPVGKEMYTDYTKAYTALNKLGECGMPSLTDW
jgi:hypothetical protein